MHALILIAHGSRRKASNEEIRCLVDKLRQKEHPYDLIEAAFLEMAEPNIHSVIDTLVENHYNEISCLPYFLAEGNHIKNDIPEIIEQATNKHTHCQIHLLDYIGAHPGMLDLIVQQINH